MGRIDTLFEKYKNNQCTPDEIEELLAYFKIGDDTELLNTHIDQVLNEDTSADEQTEKDIKDVYKKLKTQVQRDTDYSKRRFPAWWAAASVALLIAVGGYFLLHKTPKQQIVQSQRNDIAPGGNKAILILANGKKISVTDAKNGIIAKQAGMQVKKTLNGDLVYVVNAASSPAIGGAGEVAYNTIETPRGGQTHVTLADGTIAYLDASSSIKFPLAFNGKQRKVEITGQVYFEVVHKAVQPFQVNVKDETIEDIGTHFNINAYDDDPAIKTTLIEGSVSVASGRLKVILTPGQQAIDNGKTLLSDRVNTDQVIAWKNGDFNFIDENITAIMQQLRRWYNIDVYYAGKPTKEKFNAQISRNRNISAVLHLLEKTQGVHFKIEGRRVTVIE